MNINRRSFFLTAAAAAAGEAGGSAASAQEREVPNVKMDNLGPGKKSPNVRNIRGKILYIGDEDNERGREWFSFSFREDGQITLRAFCEIDDGRVERDVVYTMSADFRPLDCFVRLHSGGKFLGTGWIRITDTHAECEVFNTRMGRVSQTLELTEPAMTLGSHPLSCDALVLPVFDHSKSERVQPRIGALSTSPLLDGGSGPFLSTSSGFIEYVGPERVSTVVGDIDAHHYRFRFPPRSDRPLHSSGTPLGEDLWVTHPDYTFVRAEVYGYLKNTTGFGRYELVELDT